VPLWWRSRPPARRSRRWRPSGDRGPGRARARVTIGAACASAGVSRGRGRLSPPQRSSPPSRPPVGPGLSAVQPAPSRTPILSSARPEVRRPRTRLRPPTRFCQQLSHLVETLRCVRASRRSSCAMSRNIRAGGRLWRHLPRSEPARSVDQSDLRSVDQEGEVVARRRPLLPLDHGWVGPDCDRTRTERSEAGHQSRQVGDAGQQMGVPFGAERRRVWPPVSTPTTAGDPGITARL